MFVYQELHTSRRLRGFETGKIGPKDGTQYIEVIMQLALNLSSTLPNIFLKRKYWFKFFIDWTY